LAASARIDGARKAPSTSTDGANGNRVCFPNRDDLPFSASAQHTSAIAVENMHVLALARVPNLLKQEIAEIVGERMKLEPNGIGGERPARQPRAFAFRDPLLARSALLAKGNYVLVRAAHVTMKPTRGQSSPGCHSTLAITPRGFVQLQA
jgi:hypothetical protein